MIPNVSVIIPVYNSSVFLPRTLECVINQTLKNIEIVCINDGSTDTSVEILKKYERKDARIKIIDLPCNKGVSFARNCGIELSRGEYLGFVDSDDTVDTDFFEKLYAGGLSSNADIAKGELCHVNTEGNFSFLSTLENIKKSKFFFTDFFYTAIYKRELIRDNMILFSPALNQGEDRLFQIMAVIYANKVYPVDNTHYHYIRRKDSLNSEVLHMEKIKSGIKASLMITKNMNTLIDKFESLNNYVYVFFVQFEAIVKWLMPRNGELSSKRECAKAVMEIYNSCLQKEMLDKYLKDNGYGMYEKYLSESNIDGLIKMFVGGNIKNKLYRMPQLLRKSIASDFLYK